jgi:diguanylate cyclase (GGDEF)-like protein/PAS domain S-box-containing protein
MTDEWASYINGVTPPTFYALPASERRWQAVIETMALIGLVLDHQGQILICNDFLLALTGWERQEVVGQRWLDIFIPEDVRTSLWGVFQQGLANRCFPVHYENEIITRSGERRLIAWNNTLSYGPDGAVQTITSIGQDITDQRRATEQLQVNEERFLTALEAAGMGTWDWDLTTGTIVWSPSLEKLMGLKPGSFDGRIESVHQMIYGEDRKAVRAAIAQALEHDADYAIEFRFVRADGSIRWALSKGNIFRDAIGRPRRMSGVDIDITERKRAEQALAQTSHQLRSFMDNAPALVAMIDGDGRYIRANQALADQFGLEAAAITGQSLNDLLPPPVAKTFMARLQQVISTQTPLTVEDRLILAMGERVFNTVLFPICDDMGRGQAVGSIATDITPLVDVQLASHRQADEERLIRTITQHIHQSLDVESILQTTVTDVRQFLQADRVLIYRFNPDYSGQMVVESVISPWSVTLGVIVDDTCFMNNPELVERYRRGRISYLDTIHGPGINPCHRALLSRFQVQANLVVPISCNGELWGLLCVHHCRAPRQWQSQEITLVKQIADQMAIALYQGQLLAQTTLMAQQEKLLNNIVSAISDSLELSDLMERAAREMLQTFSASRSLVILCQASDDQLMHTTAAAMEGVESLHGQLVPLKGNPHAQQVLAQEDPVAIDDVTLSPLLAPQLDLARQFQIGAMLAVSIRYQGVVKGILSVHQCPGPRHWTPAEIRLIKRVADHLAIAIQQAELYQQAQTELRQRKRLEAQLRYDASHDRLTNLPNRSLFLDRLSHALDQYHQHYPHIPGTVQIAPIADQFAVLFLDLDRFKVINDSLGHAIGDRLLRVVAQRLSNCLLENETAARLGGDEFVILISPLPHINDAMQLVRRVHRALEVPILLDNYEIFVKASIGIALSSPSYTDPNQILRDADIAMYQAKASDREYAVFDAPMHALAVHQMQLENDLRRALERHEFELYYQPIVDLATEHLQGFEALVRWQHPERGMVSPADFIPVAENTGLITCLDLWTLNEACRQLRQWHLRFPAWNHLTVNVNLSGRQFVRSDLIQQIDRALAASQLSGQSLKVEITESVLIHNAQLAIDLLNQLRQRQIRICMDDFGTGYSSLSYLHRFPIDVLKIDQSFVSNLHSSAEKNGDYEIVKAIISLATSLNLTVVAEGIETAEQADYLRQQQCWGGQGYHFSRPLTVDAVSAFIAQQH